MTTAPTTVDHLRPGLRHALASEATKLLGVRTSTGLLVAAVVAAALMAAVFVLSVPVTQSTALSDLAPRETIGAGLLGLDVATVVVIVFAALQVGSEYATGSIATTLAVTPVRGRVLAAKALVVLASAAVAAVTSAVLCVAVTQLVLAAQGVPLVGLGTPAALRLVAGSAVTPVFYAVIAVAGAFVTRATAGGVVVGIALLLVPGVAGWFPTGLGRALIPLLPATALHSLSGASDPGSPEDISAGLAVLSLLLWWAAGIVVAHRRLTRRDA